MADTKEIINCPACGKPMVKIPVPAENINIDICLDGCGGIFFDNREFKKFDEQAENIDEIIKAIQRGIQIYSLHTNCDKTNNGTSDLIAQKLSLRKTAELNDFVRVGLAPHEMTLDELVSLVKLAFNVKRIKLINNSRKNMIKTIAVCAGAGAEFISDVEKYNIDAYITSEIKYHDALDSRRTAILDVGHFESEKPFVEQIKYLLESQKERIEVVVAQERTAWEYI